VGFEQDSVKGLFVVEPESLDLPEPELGAYDALVQVTACGVYNSTDWKIIHGEFVSGAFPVLLGHESMGRVIAVGEKLSCFRVGDLALRARLRDEHVRIPRGRGRGAECNAFPHSRSFRSAFFRLTARRS